MRRSLALLVLIAACDGGGSTIEPVDAPAVVYPYRFGFVQIEEHTLGETRVSTGFGTSSSPNISSARIVSPADGSCRDVSYPSDQRSYVDFGTLTVRSASGGEVILDAANRSKVIAAPRFAEHETITMSSTGAEVPAFSATLELPGNLVVTAPTQLGPAIPWDGTVQWNPIPDDVVVRWNDPPAYHTNAHSMICRFPGMAGTATIRPLLPGGFLSVYTETRTLRTAGDYPLELWATYVALSGSPKLVSP